MSFSAHLCILDDRFLLVEKPQQGRAIGDEGELAVLQVDLEVLHRVHGVQHLTIVSWGILLRS